MSFNSWKFGPRMAYSRATQMMRCLFQAHMEADRRGIPVDDVLADYEARARAERLLARGEMSRRDFVRRFGAATAVAAAAAVGTAPFKAAKATDARVVVIGGGLAGVRCAHFLSQHAISADIYEAANSIGGRTLSDTTTFDGLLTERGGSFISTEHNRVRNLVNNLGLSLEVINGGALSEGEDIFFIDGAFYTLEEANEDWSVAWRAFKQELRSAPFPQTFASFTQRGQELDNISVPEWFDPASPFSNPILAEFGPDSRFAKLCYTDCLVEYGGDEFVQPALNLLYLLAFNPRGSITPLPGTDELYHVEGGNQQIVERMADELLGTIHRGKPLEAISGNAEGPYTCHFSDGSTAIADKLVLALPFRILREVDIAPSIWDALTPQKRLAISRNPMGTNAKIHLELSQRTWGPDFPQVIQGQERILNGACYADPADFQCVWDDSVRVEEGPVILLNYPGGTLGASLKGSDPFGLANPSDVARVLSQVEAVFPGTSAAFTGRAAQSFWAASPWHKGAYSYWGIGDYTTYVGAAGTPELNLHFAGEHTSVEFQGFMEGAVETGARAGKEIFQSI